MNGVFFTPIHMIAQTEATFMILSYQLGLHWRKLVEIYQAKTQRSTKFEKSITKRNYMMFVNQFIVVVLITKCTVPFNYKNLFI